MKRTVTTTILMMATLVGCVPSIHGIATKENTVWDENLLGAWGDPNKADDPNAEVWWFEKGDKDCVYTLIHSADGKAGEFHVSLVQLDGELYLDLYPTGDACEKMDYLYTMHLVPAHLFIKVDEVGERLRMRMMGPDAVKKLVEKDPSLVKHEMREDQVILTAGTDELQVFLLQYADQIFGDKDKDGSDMMKIAASEGE
jgi:hypothetical protein